MRVAAVNVSLARTLRWRGREFETGIFKEPAAGRVRVGADGLAGDRQVDRRFHGGEFKAVYAYAAEHYDWWERELGRRLPPGAFGENLTIAGWPEAETCVGDRLRVGSAVLEATEPRFPCQTLAAKFSDAGIVKRFLDSGRLGVYFRVAREGELGAGDAVAWEHRDPARFPVMDIARLKRAKKKDPEALARALKARALPPQWRAKFAALLRG